MLAGFSPTPLTMAEPIPADETPNQKQARLRRERRNAKIQAGGSARLAAIMNSSGREHAAEAEAGMTRVSVERLLTLT